MIKSNNNDAIFVNIITPGFSFFCDLLRAVRGTRFCIQNPLSGVLYWYVRHQAPRWLAV